jgi:glycosyltransferase involved in cell wall biosynthesis
LPIVRAVLIQDRSFAHRERMLLSRLAVGLADEGVQIVEAVPRSESELVCEPTEVFATRVDYADVGLPLTVGLRAADLEYRIRGGPPHWEGVEIVHAFGEGCWPIAAALAARSGAALVLEVWRSGLAPAAARAVGMYRAGTGRGRRADVRVLLLAQDRALAEEVSRVPCSGAPIVAPWGVHPSNAERDRLNPELALAATIMTVVSPPTPACVKSVRAALGGMALLRESVPGLMLFADAVSAERVPLWSMVRTAGLADRFSLVHRLESRRDLVLQSDLLILPEMHGEHRTLLLDAMAEGVLVVAARDPTNSALIDGETCIQVQTAAPGTRAEPRSWAEAVQRLLADPATARAVRAGAAKFVREHRQASRYIRWVLDVYDTLARTAPRRATAPQAAAPSV